MFEENNQRVTKHLQSFNIKRYFVVGASYTAHDTEGESFDAHRKMILTTV